MSVHLKYIHKRYKFFVYHCSK